MEELSEETEEDPHEAKRRQRRESREQRRNQSENRQGIISKLKEQVSMGQLNEEEYKAKIGPSKMQIRLERIKSMIEVR